MNKLRLIAKVIHIHKGGNITPYIHSFTLITQNSHKVYAKFSKIYPLIGVTDVYNVYQPTYTMK